MSRDEPEGLSADDLAVLDTLKALKADAERIDSRLVSLEDMKAEFAEVVYRRVFSDYTQRLGAIRQQSEPLRAQARQAYAGLRDKLAAIDAAHAAADLDLEEVELRQRLGEFDEATYAKRKQAIMGSLDERRAAHADADALRQRFFEVFVDEADLVGPGAPAIAAAAAAPVAPPSPVPAPVAPAPAPSEVDAAPTRVFQVLELPELPRMPPAGSPAAPIPSKSSPAEAAMLLRTARIVPQNPEAGRAAIPLPPRPVTLGADPQADVYVGGPGVGLQHARIDVGGKGYRLTDLGSSHGTLVNAEPIGECMLHHEDVIQIGAARYVFREG